MSGDRQVHAPAGMAWDRCVRACHWLNAALVLAAYWLLEGGDRTHALAGYSVGALVLLRIGHGFLGRGHARFGNFVPTPARLRTFLRDFRNTHAHGQPLPPGHNPLGALMVLLLWTLMLLTAVSGWLQTTDYGWGEEWIQQLHAAAAHALMSAAGVHVLAVLWLQRHTGTPLVRTMLTGRRT